MAGLQEARHPLGSPKCPPVSPQLWESVFTKLSRSVFLGLRADPSSCFCRSDAGGAPTRWSERGFTWFYKSFAQRVYARHPSNFCKNPFMVMQGIEHTPFSRRASHTNGMQPDSENIPSHGLAVCVSPHRGGDGFHQAFAQRIS